MAVLRPIVVSRFISVRRYSELNCSLKVFLHQREKKGRSPKTKVLHFLEEGIKVYKDHMVDFDII